jgi:hypothetical protein
VVEFMPSPAGLEPTAARLFGTLEDRFGNQYTGWVSWDLDEILTTDILNGEDRRGRRREIPSPRSSPSRAPDPPRRA